VLRAGLAHVWFESIHPFEDGNGRVGRAIVDLALAQSSRNPTRLHGVSAQIERERDAYYGALNERQRKALNRMLEAGPGRFEGGLTARKYVGMTGASPATASRDLADLVEKRLLVPGRLRGRSSYYDLAMPGWEWQLHR
jgi:Fic family protein